MTWKKVVETAVANKSPSQDSNHPDDLFQTRYVTPGFKYLCYLAALSPSSSIFNFKAIHVKTVLENLTHIEQRKCEME